ncbi:MAG: hypothetical protein JWO36_6950, partial [Myxococcales bacterium]|nr:hypothetical protein [Myxococcales bacterium]
MTLPETDVGYAQRWVKARNERLPEHVRDQVRYELEVDPRSLTVVEFRPPWDPRRMGEEWTRSPIA